MMSLELNRFEFLAGSCYLSRQLLSVFSKFQSSHTTVVCLILHDVIALMNPKRRLKSVERILNHRHSNKTEAQMKRSYDRGKINYFLNLMYFTRDQ